MLKVIIEQRSLTLSANEVLKDVGKNLNGKKESRSPLSERDPALCKFFPE